MYVNSKYDVFWCLKFADCSSRHFSYRTQCCVIQQRSIDTHNFGCIQTTVLLASRQDLPHLKTRQYIMCPATLATVRNMLYPLPPLHTRFITPVASKVKSTITGQTARGWYLNAFLIQFSHCQKPGLKTVPLRFSSGSVIPANQYSCSSRHQIMRPPHHKSNSPFRLLIVCSAEIFFINSL